MLPLACFGATLQRSNRLSYSHRAEQSGGDYETRATRHRPQRRQSCSADTLTCSPYPVVAQDVAPVLRGRALEIVDAHGRVRASITIYPADPAVKMPDGTTGYPETVLLRLINSKGGPNVKLATTEDGAGLVLGGESNPTHVQVLARGATTSLKFSNKDGQVKVIT